MDRCKIRRIVRASLASVGVAACVARAGVIDLNVNVWADAGPLTDLPPGALVHFQVGVSVDPAASHPEYPDCGNHGLQLICYDVIGNESTAGGYTLSPTTDAASGWSEPTYDGDRPFLHDVTAPMYSWGSPTSPGYWGGWGFGSGSLPTGGDVTSSPGSILGAGIVATAMYYEDANPDYPGRQPEIRLGVGHGTYTFPEDDPVLGGLQGGFGQDIGNCHAPVVEGDGTWLFQEGVIDTSGWEPGSYNFAVTPVSGALHFPADSTWPYWCECYDGCPPYIYVAPQDLQGSSFAFTLVSPVPGDLDGDGDVDLSDFATFAICYHGAAVTTPPSGCSEDDFAASDLDGDDDVDLSDFGIFALNYGSGS